MDLSPSSSFQSDSLDSTTPKRSGPAGSLVGRKQSQKDSEAGSDGALSSRGSGSGGVKFLLALNASSSVPWGLIRAKVSVLAREVSRREAALPLGVYSTLISIPIRGVTSVHSSVPL